jgi:hypothetical protein
MIRAYADDNVIEPQVEFAIFRQSPKIRTWKDQIRWIWHIIRNKQIWSDEIILNVKQMESLSKTLNSLVEEINAGTQTNIRSEADK